MKSNSEVFERFPEFKNIMENQKGKKFWVLKTDNHWSSSGIGGEHNHYKGCAMGKNIRKPFPQSEHKSKGTLDLVH